MLIVVSGPPKPRLAQAGGGGLVPDFTAVSADRGDVENMFDDITFAGTGKIGLIPADASNWTSGISWTAPANTTIIGAGSLSQSNFGGGDVTNLIDDISSDTPLLNIGVAATGTFRLAGFTVQGGSGVVRSTALVAVYGPGTARLDHLHLDTTTYSPAVTATKILFIGDRLQGVLDHSIIRGIQNSAMYFYHGKGADAAGNQSWVNATNFGGGGADGFFVVEDNDFIATTVGPTRMCDTFSGSKVTARFNTLQGSNGPEVHAMGHSGNDRGARAVEFYGNKFTVLPSQDPVAANVADVSSGAWLVWGNETEAESMRGGLVFNVTRKNDDTYTGGVGEPTDFGYAAGTRTTGTVNVAANGVDVTKASGTNFNTAWVSGLMIRIASSNYRIASVSSTTALTLQGAGTGGALTGQTYAVGCTWDGNTDVLGYPCIDQTGRGAGQLLREWLPDTVNDATGTIAWPNQALEPVYIWNNTILFATGSGGQLYNENSLGRIVAGRDYYKQASGIQTNATTPFDGTITSGVGVGWGTIANRPTTCSVGAAYWAIDEGSWNTSASNPKGVNQAGSSGRLYKCNSTNVWTLYYTPYTYPHPLNT